MHLPAPPAAPAIGIQQKRLTFSTALSDEEYQSMLDWLTPLPLRNLPGDVDAAYRLARGQHYACRERKNEINGETLAETGLLRVADLRATYPDLDKRIIANAVAYHMLEAAAHRVLQALRTEEAAGGPHGVINLETRSNLMQAKKNMIEVMHYFGQSPALSRNQLEQFCAEQRAAMSERPGTTLSR